jgi:hypothetical protein
MKKHSGDLHTKHYLNLIGKLFFTLVQLLNSKSPFFYVPFSLRCATFFYGFEIGTKFYVLIPILQF